MIDQGGAPFGTRAAADDVGNDISRSFNDHRVADLHVQFEQILDVVQRRSPDGRAGDLHRFEQCDRGQAVLAEAPLHADQPGFAADVGEFVGDLAARMVGGVPQRVAEGEIGEFDDDAVLRIGERGEFVQQVFPLRLQLRKRHREGDQRIVDQRHLRPLQLHFGDLLQAHDSGDGVAGVLVGAAPFPADVGVEVGEVVVADHQFAACRAVDRPGVSGGLQFDQRQLVGDVLADFTVAPGREHSTVEIGGNAVVFWFDQQRFFGGAGEFFPPFEHLLERVGLVE